MLDAVQIYLQSRFSKRSNVLLLDGTFEGQAGRREKTPRRTVKVGHGGTKRADGEYDEGKHGRVAEGKTKCCGSEQDTARIGRRNAEVFRRKKWADSKPPAADTRDCKQAATSTTT